MLGCVFTLPIFTDDARAPVAFMRRLRPCRRDDAAVFITLLSLLLAAAGLAQAECPIGTQQCAAGCTPPGGSCSQGSCWDAKGQRVMCVPAAQVCGEAICPLYTFCDSSSRRCIPETCAHRQAVWCPQHAGPLSAQDCGPFAECLGTQSGGFVCQFAESGLLVTHCGDRISVGVAAALQDPEQQVARLAGCCPAAQQQPSIDYAAESGSSGSSISEWPDDYRAVEDFLASSGGGGSSSMGRSVSANSVGSMNNAVLDAEPQLPGLQYGYDEQQYELSMLEEEEEQWQQWQQQQAADAAEAVVSVPKKQQPKQQKRFAAGGMQFGKQRQQRQQAQVQQPPPPPAAPAPDVKQEQGVPAASPGNTTTTNSTSSGSSSRWSLSRLGSGLFRRAGRSLLQVNIFPEGMTRLQLDNLYPGLQSSSDPNMPFGTGRMGQFMTGLLGANMNTPQTMNLMAGLVGPSMGGPVATGKFTPVTNTIGNTVNTGSGPGGLFVRQGAGGLTTGVYGGGWAGPYNTQTGQYGMGGNYGFARPYQGHTQGTALVFMPASAAPNSPNVTYPCPVGRGNGSIIGPGVPCGIPVTAVPASMLPTMDGMLAAVNLAPFAVS